MVVDKVTKRWIFSEADEYAASLGMRVDEGRVDHLFSALCDHIVLWEGEAAGRTFTPLSWHIEVLGSIFGWIRHDPHFDRWVRRFRVASVWIGKKNGKSPTGAAVGLYLLRFDGERGQQVWSAARDGKQAMIVHRHAINMVKNSPTLRDELRINMSSGRIYWPETDSFYGVMSSDNAKSQEGLNGSVIIDETHLVDDDLARRLADMGASRPEPLRFEISTCGEGIDNYGRKQWEYGELVRDGKVKDPHFYFKAFAPPQDAKDEELGGINQRTGKPLKRTVELWKMANPTLGEILSLEELTQACQRAKRSEADWVGFKARRLMVWQQGASPWLGAATWEKAGSHNVQYEDLAGVGGGIGLDLARVNDMTAAVAVFPSPVDEDVLCLYARFWLSEDRIRQLARQHVPQFLDWVKAGWITETPGNVTDFEVVLADLERLTAHLGTQVLCFDPLFATEMANHLAETSGTLPIEFRQTYEMYSAPTNDFKRMLLAGQIQHDGNPVMAWEAGHCLVRTIDDKRMRPVKDKNVPHYFVDGIQAAVMGLHACQVACGSGSYDDDYELETF